MIKKINLYSLLLILLFINNVSGHTWLLKPQPRLDELVMPVKGGSTCGRPRPSTATTTYRRGDIITLSWGRNNHNSGYIRLYVVPLSQSDDYASYNRNNLVQTNCYMPDCTGANNSPFNGDPGGTPFNGLLCNIKFQIPTWLSDGDYTLRWLWSSGGDSFGLINLGLIDFASCHDFKISGGATGSKPSCPLFIGGDVADRSRNACEFFKNNIVNTCTDDRDCFSWYHKAPPDEIINCPTNVITLAQSQNNDFRGSRLPLYVGPTSNTRTNPSPNLSARVPVLSTPNNPSSPSPSITQQTVVVNPRTASLRSCVCNDDIEYYCRAKFTGDNSFITRTNG